MANPQHVEIVKKGKDAIALWRNQHPVEQLDLRDADLSRCVLIDAHLIGAAFTLATLSMADLSGADLSHSKLAHTDLDYANLNEACLQEALLTSASLRRSVLVGTNFNGALVGNTAFIELDLSAAQGLESVKHSDPSVIDVATLVNSKGRIPTSFLHGCGFQRWQILGARLYDPTLTPAEVNDL